MYIIKTEETIDAEFGSGRSVKGLLSKMPEWDSRMRLDPLYYEVSAKLKAARKAYHHG